jgi:hypothetical protein
VIHYDDDYDEWDVDLDVLRATVRGLDALRATMRNPVVLHRIAAVDQVHPLAQRRFTAIWDRVNWGRIRASVADDDLWFAALRKLLPEYGGGIGPLVLYRGQPQNDQLGMSWTDTLHVAENFAQATVRSLPGVIFSAELSAPEIICAPCLLGHDYEGEYIVDPRGISAALYDPWDGDPRA